MGNDSAARNACYVGLARQRKGSAHGNLGSVKGDRRDVA